MKILLIGNGARENALAWKIFNSPSFINTNSVLYAAPGNPGINKFATPVNIHSTDIKSLKEFAIDNKIDFTVVGSEIPLSLGIVDEFEKEGLKIFGPRKFAAEIETSKVFSKDLMQKYGIPTAQYKVFTGENLNELDSFVENIKFPVVIKADGLAAGKGVIICNDNEEVSVCVKDLTETKRLEEDAKRNEKLSAMGELASGVAHEIRNPINAIGMIAQRLNKEFTTTHNQNEYLDITQLLRGEVNRINKISTQFLSYAKPIDVNLRPVDIKSYLSEVYKLFEDQAKQKLIVFILQGTESITINLDADLIKQSLMNILQNAFDASKKDGEVTIKYFRISNNLIIEISDNGVGISAEQQKKIFDLYFTTKKDGNGLGLSISQKIIAQHNGSISVTSNVNKGTTFKIILPIQ